MTLLMMTSPCEFAILYTDRTYRDSSPSFGWSVLPISSSSESPSFVLFLAPNPNEKGEEDTSVILFRGVQGTLDLLNSESMKICFSFPSNSDGLILVIRLIPMLVCRPGLSRGSPVLEKVTGKNPTKG